MVITDVIVGNVAVVVVRSFRCSIRHRPAAAAKAVFTAIMLNMVYNGSSNLRFKPRKAGKPYRNTLQYNLYNVAI